MTVNAEGKVVKVKVVQDYDGKSGVFYLIVCLHWMKLDVLAIKFDYIPFTCCISGRSLRWRSPSKKKCMTSSTAGILLD